MTGYDARKAVLAVVDMVNGVIASVTSVSTALVAFMTTGLMVTTRCSVTDQVVPKNTGALVISEYEIGPGFTTELAVDGIMEIAI